MTPGAAQRPGISASEFRALYERLRHQHGWGPDDRRGALNNITPSSVLAAATNEVRLGRSVGLAAPVETSTTPDNPEPAGHEMTGPPGGHAAASGLDFAMDRLTMNIHGNADSHLDALCHVIYDGELYNGVAADTITQDGATALSVDEAHDGIVSRGVLLDIPRLRNVPWLEPGDHVHVDELLAAERAEHVSIGQGDILLVRVGHRRRRAELGPWNAAEERAGLHPAAMELLADRGVAVLGSDGNNDTAPSAAAGVAFPVHVLAIEALGLYLLDYLQLEDLMRVCGDRSRWTFLCVIAPLRLPTGTGSPVNPIAII
ncbi:MAG TPA: cyclase family protein [Acidimicrobiales bacterium]